MSTGLMLAIAACLVALVWKGHHLWRAPWDRALWTVLAAVLWLLVSLVAVAAPELFRPVIGNGGTLFLSTIAGQGFALLLVAFFHFADRSRHRRNALWVALQLVPFAAVAATSALLLSSLPPALREQSYATADLEVPQVAAFYVTGNLYLLYAVGFAAVLAGRVGRRSDTRTRRGLLVAVTGLSLMAVSGGLRALSAALRAGGQSATAIDAAVPVILPVGLVLFCVGAVAPGAVTRWASFRRWSWHRRVHRDLEPLWSHLTRAFPDGELGRYPDVATKRRGRVHRRCSRRVVECRDSLVRIGPHLRALGIANGETEPAVLAPALHAALDQRAAGREVDGAAIMVAPPASASLDDDIRSLVALSRAMPPPVTPTGGP